MNTKQVYEDKRIEDEGMAELAYENNDVFNKLVDQVELLLSDERINTRFLRLATNMAIKRHHDRLEREAELLEEK